MNSTESSQLPRPVHVSTTLQKGWVVFPGIPVASEKQISWKLDGAVARRYSAFLLCTRLWILPTTYATKIKARGWQLAPD